MAKLGNKELCVRRSYFTGRSRDDTANVCKMSATTVSDIWRELAEEIGPDGVAVRDLHVRIRKENLTISEAADGAEAYKSLKKLAVPLDRLGSFAEDIYQKSVEEGLTGHSIGDLLVRLSSFAKSTKIAFEQVSKSVEADRGRLEKLQKEIGEAEFRLKQYKVALTALEEYVAVRGGLKERGFTIGDSERTVNVLANLEELGHDPKKVVEELQAATSMKKNVKDLQYSVKRLHSEREAVESKLGKLKEEVKEKRGALDNLAWMERNGFTPERIRDLRNVIVKISSARAIDSRNALDAFFKSLKSYDAKAGFDYEIGKLKFEKEGLKTNVADLIRELEDLQKKVGTRKDAVDALEWLQEKGLKDRDILHWRKILAKSGVSGYEVSEDVERYGSLKLACEKRGKENAALETKQKILQGEIRDLDGQRSGIEASIKGLTDAGLTQIEKVSTDSQTEIKELVTRIIELLKVLQGDSVNYGEQIGKLGALRPILDLLQGKPVDEFELHTAVAMILDKSSGKFPIRNSGPLNVAIYEAVKQLNLRASELASLRGETGKSV